jgi:hypothetical protein
VHCQPASDGYRPGSRYLNETLVILMFAMVDEEEMKVVCWAPPKQKSEENRCSLVSGFRYTFERESP